MSIDGLITVYRVDTGETVRIPPHWLDNPVLGRPFRLTPKARGNSKAAESKSASKRTSKRAASKPRRPVGSTDTAATPAPDLDTPSGDPAAPTTETPAAGAKE